MTKPLQEPGTASGQSGPGAPRPTSAGLGGVGAGTGLVAIANAIGPKTAIGAVLLYLAPALSFGLGVGFYYIQLQVVRYFERRMIRVAKKTLEDQLDNPRTSTAHKAKIRKMLEALEASIASAELERVRLIKTPLHNLAVVGQPMLGLHEKVAPPADAKGRRAKAPTDSD